MANVSDWKGFEKMVANALGGKRRFRTTENYGKTADDVKFSKFKRRRFPKLKEVSIECKKRKNMNIHVLFAEAKSKYGNSSNKNIILASKVTKRGTLKRDLLELEIKMRKKAKKKRRKFDKIAFEERKNRLKAKHDISALVTVELDFFAKLWHNWAFKDGDWVPKEKQ
jgi:hypothetical protein